MRPLDPVAESLLAFWAEAGIDSILVDVPVDRIAAGAVPLLRPAPAQVTAKPSQHPTQARTTTAEVARAQEAAQACQTLDDLKTAIEEFDGCPLKFQGAKRTVFSRGAADAPVFVVGEGPGQEEDQRGLPFVGRAGQLLDKMFAAAGLTDRVFITNSVFWRPPATAIRPPTSRPYAFPSSKEPSPWSIPVCFCV